MTTAAAIQLLLQLLAAVGPAMQQIQTIRELVTKLHAENRDPTPEEWAAVDAANKAARDHLAASIAAAESISADPKA